MSVRRSLHKIFRAICSPRYKTGAPVAKSTAVCVSPTLPRHSNVGQSLGAAAITNPDGSLLAQQAVDDRVDTAYPWPAMAIVVRHGFGVTDMWADFSSAPRTAGSLGLVCERMNRRVWSPNKGD